MGATVSAGYAQGLFDYAVARGASPQQLLEAANLPSDAFSNPDARLSMESYKNLTWAAKALCNAPALALEFCDDTRFEELSVVGLIVQSAPKMAEVLKQLSRYSHLVAEVDLGLEEERFEVTPIDGQLWIVDNRKSPNDFIELTEGTFGRFVCEFRRHFGDVPFAQEVHVTHPAPEYAAAYEEILQVPVTFNSDRNAMRIDPSWLEVEVSPANEYLFGVLTERGDALLDDLASSANLTAQVEKMVLLFLHTGEINMEHIAKEMGLSRQTLYRKLKAEGANFENLLDQLRHKMALHYLNGQKVSVNETAYLVGFSDPSSFSRAFKRWTGTTPGALRQ